MEAGDTKRIRQALELLRLIRAKPDAATKKFAAELGISRRTIFRHIALLNRLGYQCHFNAQTGAYDVINPPDLNPPRWTNDETLALMAAARLAGPRRLGPLTEKFRSAIRKLYKYLPPIAHFRSKRLLGGLRFVGPELSRVDRGGPRLLLLLRSILKRQPLRVTYTPRHSSESITAVLSPRLVVRAKQRWYAIGYNSASSSLTAHDLSEIVALEPIDAPYITSGEDVEEWLDSAWLIEPGEQRCKVCVRFSPKVADEVARMRWHPRQRLTRDDSGALRFEVTIRGIEEIACWILGYGADAEVLEPAELRELMRNTACRMVDAYDSAAPAATPRTSKKPEKRAPRRKEMTE